MPLYNNGHLIYISCKLDAIEIEKNGLARTLAEVVSLCLGGGL